MSSWEPPLLKLEFEKVRTRLLRYASSDPGREILGRLRVMTSSREIREELAKVSEAKRLLEHDEALPLEGVHPVRDSAAKAAVDGMTLPPRELHHIALTLRAARLVRTSMAKKKEEYPRLWKLSEPLQTDKVLEYNIDNAIDDSGAVRAGASRELLAIRRAIADRYEDLRKQLASILRAVTELGFSQDEIITTREGRMVIPVKAEHKNRVPGFIHSASASGATVFIEPTETLELNNDIRGLQFDEQREVEKILKSLTVQVGERKMALQANLEILAELDALTAKAKYSIETLGIEPVITEQGALRLVQARHPLLLLSHGHGATVPLDIEVGGNWTTLLISGPNAGGKSVAMKCVGLLVVMTQCGLHIPASDGTCIRVFRSCYVDIGDEQSIENDLSTFSSHLANLKSLTDEADSGSLVLIDEIGSGTDPAEGGAIAAALLEELTRRGSVTIATTHQVSLKAFAHETPGVANGAMEFDQAALSPTYRFRPGIPGSSYALEMASRLGFQRTVMDRARAILGVQHTRLDALITELETASQETRKELKAVNDERARLNALVREYEEKIRNLSAELRSRKRAAIDEAGEIIARANALIEKSIREIRERNADRESVRQARDDVDQVRRELNAMMSEVAPEPPRREAGTVDVGSPVMIASGSDVGEVASISADGKAAVVVFGGVKMRVAVAELLPARRRAEASPSPESLLRPEKPGTVRRDLDLRGMKGEEAIPLVDKFIDDAVLSGLHRIDIIHGKGTGALRKKIAEFLSTHPRVKGFRLGEWNEGGAGATVVELTES